MRGVFQFRLQLQPGQRRVERGDLHRGLRVRRADVAVLRLAVVAEHHRVFVGRSLAPWRHCGIGRRCRHGFRHERQIRRGLAVAQRLAAAGAPGGSAEHRRAHRRDPGVAAVQHPVRIRQQREAVKAPLRAPGVLHDEALRGVADQRESVAIGRVAVAGDHRQRGRLLRHRGPAVVYRGGDVDRADLVYRRLHVGDRSAVDAVIRAQRPQRRVLLPALPRRDELALFIGVRPQRRAADAVAMPAFHRAAAARSVVVLARPLVVLARQLVEHAWADADALPLVFSRIAPGDEIDHAGEAKTGAGALGALVQHQALRGDVRAEPRQLARLRRLRRQGDQRRRVDAVAKVDAIRARIEATPAVADRRRHFVAGGHALSP